MMYKIKEILYGKDLESFIKEIKYLEQKNEGGIILIGMEKKAELNENYDKLKIGFKMQYINKKNKKEVNFYEPICDENNKEFIIPNKNLTIDMVELVNSSYNNRMDKIYDKVKGISSGIKIRREYERNLL